MLDVVNKQLLVLHLVLQAESDERQYCFSVGQTLRRLQKHEDLLIDMIAVSNRIFDGRARFRAAFWTLDSYAKTFVIGIEVEEVVFRINAITRLVGLQDCFKEP